MSDAPEFLATDTPSDASSDVLSDIPSDIPSGMPSITPSNLPAPLPTKASSSVAPSTAEAVEDVSTNPSLLELIADSSDLKQLSSLLAEAGVDATFDMSASQYTIFAPTDAAFNAISFLVDDWSDEALVQVLSYHVVTGVYTSSDLYNGMQLTTLLGNNLTITMDPVMVNGKAWIDSMDDRAYDGVVHTISTVLLPLLSEDETVSPTPAPTTALSINTTNATTMSNSTGCGALLSTYASICCPLENQAFAAFCEDLLNTHFGV
jgi:uncharacterized surface protein with fasciclin (FAS1) repeats